MTQSRDPRDVEDLFEADDNLLIIARDLIIVDIDCKPGGKHNGYETLGQYPALPLTPCSSTPSGGQHHFFSMAGAPSDFLDTNRYGATLPGIDIRRGPGHYVVAAPSWIADAEDGLVREYTWMLAPWDYPLAPAPGWLFDALRKPEPKPGHEALLRKTRAQLLRRLGGAASTAS